MTHVKLKTTGRIGEIISNSVGGQHSVVMFKPEGKECTRTKAKGIIQTIRSEKLEEVK